MGPRCGTDAAPPRDRSRGEHGDRDRVATIGTVATPTKSRVCSTVTFRGGFPLGGPLGGCGGHDEIATPVESGSCAAAAWRGESPPGCPLGGAYGARDGGATTLDECE